MMQNILNKLVESSRYLESIIWDRLMNVDTAHSSDALVKITQGIKEDSIFFQTSAHIIQFEARSGLSDQQLKIR